MRLAILLWRQRARSMCQDREAGLGALGAVMVGAEEAGHVAGLCASGEVWAEHTRHLRAPCW